MLKKINTRSILSATFMMSLFGVSSYASGLKMDTTPPEITYTEERIGDRDALRVTVTAIDESGIKELRNPQGNTIVGDTITIEFNRRVDSTFTAIDNAGNENSVTVDLHWINPYVKGTPGALLRGSAYWTSSNLREWLNSDAEIVRYTNKSNDADKGFLYEFTKEEKDAIAITERRIMLDDYATPEAVDGGRGNMGHPTEYGNVFLANSYDMAFNYKSYAHKKDMDKIFLLTAQEAYWYLSRRGYEYKIPLTQEAKVKNNYFNDFRDWWIQGCSNQDGYETSYIGKYEKDVVHHIKAPNTKLGVVPAMIIKSDYTFEDGKVADSLSIGDKVFFGRYLGSELEWRVINIIDKRFPVLMCSNVVDLKKVNEGGSRARLYSDILKFDNFDVSVFNDVNYVPSRGIDDVEPPKIEILNKSELDERFNNSFDLYLKFVDDKSGVDYIENPKGEKILNQNEISYTFDKNGLYRFRVCDKSGNYNDFLIAINNINEEPYIELEASSSNWSNNVSVNIFTSSNVVQEISYKTISNGEMFRGGTFPNYNSYTGKKFKISGNVSVLNEYKKDSVGINYLLNIGFYYKMKGENEYTQTIRGKWPVVESVLFDDLVDGEQYFEIEYMVPNDFAYDLQPFIQTNKNSLQGSLGTFEIRNLRYELVDDGEYKIESIELPDGSIVTDTYSVVDYILTEGVQSLTYKILDSRGKITEKTITVKVDKTKPILDLNYDYDKFEFLENKMLQVNMSASDALSGFKRIKLPDGTYTSSSNTVYTISDYGTYVFECEDVAGNITKKVIEIEDMSNFEDAEKLVEIAEQTRDPKDIEIAREAVNKLFESSKKDELQDRLNVIFPDISLDAKAITSNLDIYIKSKNMLSLSLDTNLVSFDDFSGVEEMEKQNAVNLTVSSSLPYTVKAYLATEIQNADKSKTMDKSILNIKANSESIYETFSDTVTPIILLDNQIESNNINHGIDLKLKGNIAHEKDVYKTTIKIEVEQK